MNWKWQFCTFPSLWCHFVVIDNMTQGLTNKINSSLIREWDNSWTSLTHQYRVCVCECIHFTYPVSDTIPLKKRVPPSKNQFLLQRCIIVDNRLLPWPWGTPWWKRRGRHGWRPELWIAHIRRFIYIKGIWIWLPPRCSLPLGWPTAAHMCYYITHPEAIDWKWHVCLSYSLLERFYRVSQQSG